ncbi:unnamed protein product [Linum trigynum]
MNTDLALFLSITGTAFFLVSTLTVPINADEISYHQHQPMQAALKSFIASRRPSLVSIPSSPPRQTVHRHHGRAVSRVYEVTAYGADPTGTEDSTEALLKVFADVLRGPTSGTMLHGMIKNFGGAQINLAGGIYLISRPLRFPVGGVGNVVILGGSLRASDDFPTDGYLINLSTSSRWSSTAKKYDYEYITLRDLMLDSNFRGGGVFIRDSARISIDNCYITHLSTDGISINGGLDNLVRNTFIGQHITNGSDAHERHFSGTGIALNSGDNAITNVVIFSAAVGINVTRQANFLSGVHCYNKGHKYGGVGIYLNLSGRAQTHIVNSYLDFTGIVAEDPVQLTVANSFFLEAFIVFKSKIGVAKWVTVVNNMFSGLRGKMVVLDGKFEDIDNVLVDGNEVGGGMGLKATVALGSTKGRGKTSWVVDFNQVLLFPRRITHAHYTLTSIGTEFPRHALRNVTRNRVVVESDIPVTGTVYATVRQ